MFSVPSRLSERRSTVTTELRQRLDEYLVESDEFTAGEVGTITAALDSDHSLDQVIEDGVFE